MAERLNDPSIADLERIQAEDDWDVIVNGKPFYGGGAKNYSHRQVMTYWKSRDGRIFSKPPQRENLDDVTSNFLFSTLKKATDAGIKFYAERSDLRSYHLIVLGVGLAEHLPILSGLTECRGLIVIEPDPALLAASMHTFDWSALINRFKSKSGFRFDMAILDDPDEIYSFIYELINFHPNPTFMDGLCIFQHYESDILARAVNRLVSSPQTLIAGFGFLYDNLNIVQNNYFNLRDNKPRIFNVHSEQRRLTAFVIGAGPSIDNDLHFIQKHADNVMVITCGSSISIMLENGVIPDVHVEIENVPEALEMLSSVARKHDLSPVRLMGSTTMYPGIPALFKKIFFYFRSGVAPFHQFRTGCQTEIRDAVPSVANLGLALAGELGCDQICLFGVDLGAHDPKSHHAADTAYMQGEIEFEWFGDEVKSVANFGGEIFTNEFYLRAQERFSRVASRFNGAQKFYNCSDGLHIPGFLSLHAPELPILPLTKEKKLRAVEKAFSKFEPYQAEAFTNSWNELERQASNTALRDHLLQLIREHDQGYNKVIEGLMRLSEEIAFYKTSMESHIYRGSLIHAIMAAYFFMTRAGNEDDRNKFSSIVSEDLALLIHSLSDSVSNFYTTLRDPKSAQLMPYFRNHPDFKS